MTVEFILPFDSSILLLICILCSLFNLYLLRWKVVKSNTMALLIKFEIITNILPVSFYIDCTKSHFGKLFDWLNWLGESTCQYPTHFGKLSKWHVSTPLLQPNLVIFLCNVIIKNDSYFSLLFFLWIFFFYINSAFGE